MGLGARQDMSDSLIHFTRGDALDDAFERFRTIVSECRLIGGTGMIRGGFSCVCLSEAPLPLSNGLVNESYYSKYSPFGVMFKKQWVFAQGGRPVIYQPAHEYLLLPEAMRWRHVTYEPPNVDFTWEREWRMCCPELDFDPGVASLILPSGDYLERLISDHEDQQDAYWYQYSEILSQEELMWYRDDFPWRIVYIGR